MTKSITKQFKKFLTGLIQNNIEITKDRIGENKIYSIEVSVISDLLNDEGYLKQHMKLLAEPCVKLLTLDSEISTFNITFATKFDGWKENILEINFKRNNDVDWQRFLVEFVKEKE